MNIFIGNLNYKTTDEALRAFFETYGKVASAKVIKAWDTGRSRGFGFVEMPNEEEAKAAISLLNGKELDGRPLRVNEAQSKAGRGGGDHQD